jgi:hypothetical protein
VPGWSAEHAPFARSRHQDCEQIPTFDAGEDGQNDRPHPWSLMGCQVVQTGMQFALQPEEGVIHICRKVVRAAISATIINNPWH